MNNSGKQQQMEQMFNKQQNFFYETIKKYVHEKNGKGILINNLKSIANNLSSNKDITIDEFVTLGSLSYLVGIDYTNQPYISREISDKVSDRFKEFELDQNTTDIFVEVVSLIKEKSLHVSKDKMKSLVSKEIVFSENEITSKIELNVLRANIIKFLNLSIFPVSMSASVEEIKQKKNFTYEDILKVSTLIQTQCKIPGNAIKNLIKINSNQLYQKLIEKAMFNFDKQKFAVVYLDSILSVNESFDKFGILSHSALKQIILGGQITDLDYEIFKNNFEAKAPEVITPDETTDVYVPHYSGSEVNAMMENNPDAFINEVFCDMIKSDIEIEDGIILAISSILVDSDYSQHMYSYLKSQMKSPKRSVANFKIIYPGLSLDLIINNLQKSEDDFKEEYKTLVELTCKNIPNDILNKLINFVNRTIEGLILDNDDQKQYLISQIIENGISTYQHLQQIVGLIETCDINGKDTFEYITLYNYLNQNEEILNVFEKSKEIEIFTSQISIVRVFREWFEFYNQYATTSIEK